MNQIFLQINLDAQRNIFYEPHDGRSVTGANSLREYFLNCVSSDRSDYFTSMKGLINVSSERQNLI